ncbi:unnamed protein product [Rotaria socialis]|uniref:Methyltransferase type 11 domain-containing protein n=1 Tax=Rotaria socialis TaxID=392032 RepID=A0A819X278_9BILA|nr:unnamed protein product [Rotaria socialis]CAF3699936.1 unnamed protein product [Rotaria socialis]CAF3701435.1 unnamed protein product [Rotaria socialis]CAF4130309.1 unnamed protein product [Rotaria socialis]CAF4342359.1 unnamed protein product [Rotaria socialis]
MKFYLNCLKVVRLYSINFNRQLSISHKYFQRPETLPNVFDRKTKLKQRERTCLDPDYKIYSYVHERVAQSLVDRIFDIKRTFESALDFGCGRGLTASELTKDVVKRITMIDSSSLMLDQIRPPVEENGHDGIEIIKKHIDEEQFSGDESSYDLAYSCLSLHWINDLPGVLRKVLHALKNDAPFIGAMFASDTLYELRVALQLAENEREGGFAAHISPFVEPPDIGGLLQRIGYNIVTLDLDEIHIDYPSMFELMFDLKGMGENNCSWNRRLTLKRETLLAAQAIYQNMYGNKDGSIPATYRILYFIGWKPDPSQKGPAKRGSANVSFKDIDKVLSTKK